MTQAEKHHQLKVAAAFGLVYVLWGGTYLAMKVAVDHIPPYVMGAIRYLLAGPLMLGYLALIGRKIRMHQAVLPLCPGSPLASAVGTATTNRPGQRP